jgi:hypothetical protein
MSESTPDTPSRKKGRCLTISTKATPADRIELAYWAEVLETTGAQIQYDALKIHLHWLRARTQTQGQSAP